MKEKETRFLIFFLPSFRSPFPRIHLFKVLKGRRERKRKREGEKGEKVEFDVELLIWVFLVHALSHWMWKEGERINSSINLSISHRAFFLSLSSLLSIVFSLSLSIHHISLPQFQEKERERFNLYNENKERGGKRMSSNINTFSVLKVTKWES